MDGTYLHTHPFGFLFLFWIRVFFFVKLMLNVSYCSNANFIGPIRTSLQQLHFISSLNITIFIPKTKQIMWQMQHKPIAQHMQWAMWIIVF